MGAVAVFGVGTLLHSVYSLYAQPIGRDWFVLAGLTVLTGLATVKLPSVPATISISEAFVFTSTLLYGPAAGTLIVALDALTISFSLARRGHPAYRLLFNVCALPASLWLGAHVFFWHSGLPPLAALAESGATIDIRNFVTSLVLFTTCYFALNSWFIAIAIAVEKRLAPFRVWKENFAWLWINYVGGASVAALVVIYNRNLDYGFLLILAPFLVIVYISYRTAVRRAADSNRHLSQLNKLYMSTIETLAMAIDAKDQITHGHIRRVQHYAVALAKRVGINDAAQISAIEAASLLHDMGKLAVPEYILNKPGALTRAEFEKMKLHASVGADILGAIEFPYPVVPIVRHHHENWDGTGYPDGLAGTDIPIGARILSVVDCFDALTSDRPYRPKLSDAEALKILVQRRANMYDPVIVDSFVSAYRELAPPVEKQTGPAKKGLSAITRGQDRTNTSSSEDRLQEINASTEEMVVLYDLARGLSGRISFSDATEIVARNLRRMVPTSTFVFYVHDEDVDELIATRASGEHAGHFASLRIARGQRLTGWVGANRMSVRNSDPVLDLGEAARSVRPALRSCLSTAIVSTGDLVGVLTAYSTQPDAYSEDHQRILEAVASQIGPTLQGSLSFDKDQQKRQSQDMNLPDLLQLEKVLASELETHRVKGGLAILHIDLKPTKRPGYLPDSTISTVVDTLQRLLGPEDQLFRLSDSTFVAMLPSMDRQMAAAMANRVCDLLRDLVAGQGSGLGGALVGVASAPADGLALPTLIAIAKKQSQSIQPGGHHRSIH